MKLIDLLIRGIAKGPDLLRDRIRSALWSRILKCPGLALGSSASIIGDRQMSIGRDFRAGRMLWLEAVVRYGNDTYQPVLRIGERFSGSDCVHIACSHSVTIGDDVLFGSKVHVTDHNHGAYPAAATSSPPLLAPARRPLRGRPTVIEDRVFLGDGVVVLPGSYIEAGTIVGANSVVSGRLPSNTICVGSPARPFKRFDQASQCWIVI